MIERTTRKERSYSNLYVQEAKKKKKFEKKKKYKRLSSSKICRKSTLPKAVAQVGVSE